MLASTQQPDRPQEQCWQTPGSWLVATARVRGELSNGTHASSSAIQLLPSPTASLCRRVPTRSVCCRTQSQLLPFGSLAAFLAGSLANCLLQSLQQNLNACSLYTAAGASFGSGSPDMMQVFRG